MSDSLPENFTQLICEAARHDPTAGAKALEAVYEALKNIARRQVARERDGLTLNATALVHEAYVALFHSPKSAANADTDSDTAPQPEVDLSRELADKLCTTLAPTAGRWADRKHFFRSAAEAMRHVLIDHARARGRDKRGGWKRVEMDSLNVVDLASQGNPEQILAIDEAIAALRKEHPEPGEVVQLKFWTGLTNEQVAATMDLGVETVKRRWRFARAYLASRLRPADGQGE